MIVFLHPALLCLAQFLTGSDKNSIILQRQPKIDQGQRSGVLAVVNVNIHDDEDVHADVRRGRFLLVSSQLLFSLDEFVLIDL